VFEFAAAGAETWGELVLHRDQTTAEDLSGLVDLRDVGVRDADELNDSLVDQVAERADGVGICDVRVGAVELVETDRLYPEATG